MLKIERQELHQINTKVPLYGLPRGAPI